jgi:hypothetical protein
MPVGSDKRIQHAFHSQICAQDSVLPQQLPVKYKMTVIPHPLQPPDLALCDFFLFPNMKLKLKGHWFDTIEEIQTKFQRLLDTLTEKDFQEVFQKWRWRKWCLHVGGKYFKDDGGQ